MNPSDRIDEIIQDVAIRHGYVISRDDPVLMTYTINQKVMESSAGVQRAVLEDHLRGMKEISKDLQDHAASQMDKVLREATESIANARKRSRLSRIRNRLRGDLRSCSSQST